MDDQGTWPVPLSAQDGTDARAFDRQMMDEIRSDPQALQEIGGVKGNVLIVLVPLLAAIAAVVLLLQWMRDGSWVWPAILAVVLIVAGVVWIGRLRAVMGQARQVLGQAATGSVGYGIGIIRELRIGGDAAGVDDDPADHAAEEAPNAAGADETSDGPAEDGSSTTGPIRDADPADESELSEDEDDDLSSVEVQLTLSVTPGRGKPFTAQLSQRYATVDALRLERGQHGPVRYLLRSPETTAAVDASLSPDAVQRLYRAAALNG
ncbi:hypothetical protein GCM10009594_24730 [Kocuria palustris]|uniref:hypothetical protein n=1 Tax=Kocuria palustris TaxID=71999 RepID=UPI001958345F|nr:hypothetical protein [Kocuria palustris]MBM7822940.1 hypothetical protein [Kocuria palustris]